MKTNLGKIIAMASMVGLLASCAQTGSMKAENADTRKAAASARTYADHDRLAKQYRNTAKESFVGVAPIKPDRMRLVTGCG
ncbi:MAG: hypothetical protein ABI167_11885 [Nitrosospira sp.]